MKQILIITLLISGLFSCSGTKETAEASDALKDIPQQFKGKVLVSMMPEVEIAELESKFSKYSLEHLSVASRSQNQHLFSFDNQAIDTESLLKKLNKSKKVYKAEALVYSMDKVELGSSGKKKNVDIK